MNGCSPWEVEDKNPGLFIRGQDFYLLLRDHLENEFQAQLQDARVVRCAGKQEIVGRKLVAVGIHGVSTGAGIPGDRAELGVVEDVKALGARSEERRVG